MNRCTRVVHEMPGREIYLQRLVNDAPDREPLTDREALQIAADLVQAVVTNERTKK